MWNAKVFCYRVRAEKLKVFSLKYFHVLLMSRSVRSAQVRHLESGLAAHLYKLRSEK